MNINQIRSLFPQLQEKVYAHPLVYLDNAATSLRPKSVIDKWKEMSIKHNSNIHRAVHKTAVDATEEYESARIAVAEFIGALPEETIFTSGTTHSVNMLAAVLERSSFFSLGDEILIAESEHHSDIVPWQLLARRKGFKIKVLPVNDKGETDVRTLSLLLTPNTKLCCIAQISNVLGIINPIEEIVQACHANGTLVFVDGAQGITHVPTDVKSLDCDFYAFSGHKMYAAPGTGVLYGKKHFLQELPPYMGGGEMIESVSWEKTSFAPVPGRFEAGTQNLSGVPTFKPAIETCKLLRDREIKEHTKALTTFVYDALSSDPYIRVFGTPDNFERKIPIFSIVVKGAHHEDLALILDKMGIATRSGQMCAEPLMDRFGVTGMLRVSFAPYNTIEEAEYFIKSLHNAINMLK